MMPNNFILNGDIEGLSNFLNKAENPTINHAVAYIKNNVTVKLTSENIAKAVKTNKRYLFANFKRETGKTLVQCINKEKVKKACYYLQFTDKSLADISSSLSFSMQSYFQSVFKKITGQTPSDWRKNNMYFK